MQPIADFSENRTITVILEISHVSYDQVSSMNVRSAIAREMHLKDQFFCSSHDVSLVHHIFLCLHSLLCSVCCQHCPYSLCAIERTFCMGRVIEPSYLSPALSTQPFIRSHTEQVCNAAVSNAAFSIVNSASNELDLRILEYIYIHDRKPILNDKESAFNSQIIK